MYANAQTFFWQGAILKTVKLCAKAIAQIVSVRAGKGSADYIDGFLGQMKRRSK
jgi:hypothetical protein